MAGLLASFEGLRPGPRARAERIVQVEEAQIDPLLRRLSALRSAIFALE